MNRLLVRYSNNKHEKPYKKIHLSFLTAFIFWVRILSRDEKVLQITNL